MQPRHDPLQVFIGSKTPVGLYARQKWRREGEKATWVHDLGETVKALLAGQLANGSWDNSEITTIHKLFGLHLTVREPDDAIGRALEWLLSETHLGRFLETPRRVPDEIYDETVLHGLPFTGGCFGHFAVCAGLFLACSFGMGEESMVTRLYDTIAGEIEQRAGRWCSVGCTNSALRAFIKHPRYSKSRTTDMMADYLGRRQLPSGKWRGRTPWYMTFNALAHLDSENARRQCMAAVDGIVKAQNKDGSWGRTQKEWNTFLVLHALNKLNA